MSCIRLVRLTIVFVINCSMDLWMNMYGIVFVDELLCDVCDI
jgi:hypothetical protein